MVRHNLRKLTLSSLHLTNCTNGTTGNCSPDSPPPPPSKRMFICLYLLIFFFFFTISYTKHTDIYSMCFPVCIKKGVVHVWCKRKQLVGRCEQNDFSNTESAEKYCLILFNCIFSWGGRVGWCTLFNLVLFACVCFPLFEYLFVYCHSFFIHVFYCFFISFCKKIK